MLADTSPSESSSVHAWVVSVLTTMSSENVTKISERTSTHTDPLPGDQLITQGPHGDLVFTERPRFTLPSFEEIAGGFVAQTPGKVIELRVQVGDAVCAGDMLLVLEAMKMEHPMRASHDGVVTEVHVAQGDQVEAGTLLLVVEPPTEP